MMSASLGTWSLRNTCALVTGGTKGIGAAIVQELCQLGSDVVLCARSEADVESSIQAARDQGIDSVHGIVGDVSISEDREKILRYASEQFDGKLDILVNNVGTNVRREKTVDYTRDDVDHLLQTNLSSCFHMCQQAHPMLLRTGAELESRGSASIVNISSVAGVTALRTGAVYAMSKAAMQQLTANLACEWAPQGIRVNCVAPWYISTPLAEQVLKDQAYKQEVLSRTPLGRIGTPHEVAAVVAFLCMRGAGYTTGVTMAVDGGFSKNAFY